MLLSESCRDVAIHFNYLSRTYQVRVIRINGYFPSFFLSTKTFYHFSFVSSTKIIYNKDIKVFGSQVIIGRQKHCFKFSSSLIFDDENHQFVFYWSLLSSNDIYSSFLFWSMVQSIQSCTAQL